MFFFFDLGNQLGFQVRNGEFGFSFLLDKEETAENSVLNASSHRLNSLVCHMFIYGNYNLFIYFHYYFKGVFAETPPLFLVPEIKR